MNERHLVDDLRGQTVAPRETADSNSRLVRRVVARARFSILPFRGGDKTYVVFANRAVVQKNNDR